MRSQIEIYIHTVLQKINLELLRDQDFSIATSSMATELAKGKSVEEALELTNLAVAEALDGLPPIKMHCSNLAADGLRAAIYDYKVKNGMSTEGIEVCSGCCHDCGH